jgi:hypothetical protein
MSGFSDIFFCYKTLTEKLSQFLTVFQFGIVSDNCSKSKDISF